MGVCDNSWGLDLYQLVRVPVKCASNGYYLRWWYNGWHYWFFLPGNYSKVTEGENYRTIGTRKIKMSSGQITTAQAKAIRTILNTREVYLLTIAGWMNIRVEPGTINIFDNRVGAVEIEIVAIIGSKEISYTSGYSPVLDIPAVAPSVAYCEVTIGTQIWMCRNFYSDYPGSKVYNNDEANRNPYGGLYTWNQIMSPGFCPAGWHVPTTTEWSELINFIGTLVNGGGILKEAGFIHWTAPNTGAVDTYGFAMVGSGYYLTSFLGLYAISNLWTATEFDSAVAFFSQVSYDSAAIAFNSVTKNAMFGVRLIKDSLPPPVTFTATTTTVGLFSIGIQGEGNIHIDWGDGNEEDGTLVPSAYTLFTHVYIAGGVMIITADVLKAVNLQSQNITVCDIPSTCTAIEIINLFGNTLIAFTAYSTWRNLVGLNLGGGNSLITFVAYPEWNYNITTFSLAGNAINVAADINNILIALDGTDCIASIIDLTGGTNASPTGAGVTAKNSLIAKGNMVTTN